ncbi:glucose-specific phosphotransferase system IIA component [Weissella uvarum]|uniref:PTS sugar transporter subunit IIA n=1 Tax=Weissella uvarum TaxID=1479233 RepID=UPI0019621BA5|nr:PTS glucose transporter subunit IIA [Weissella uvarum]MBM7616551.1 glucose-specific phosphotransferase system IIA component [Weissella uvarum]MCM0594989.1 PTS glucose transporter subunit IIA [Weissella uvarum]
MFGFGKKKTLIEDARIFAATDGQLHPLADVADPVFATGMMGDGYAIEPTDVKQVVAPVYAKVTVVQGHAIGMERADGLQFLVHVGIDTVNLNGAPFKATVAVGDIVEPGDTLVEVDWAAIDASGLAKTVMVLMPNEQKLGAHVAIDTKPRTVTVGDELGSAQR